jgi:hypothetical protein
MRSVTLSDVAERASASVDETTTGFAPFGGD